MDNHKQASKMASPTVSAGCVSSPILEAFVMKVSEVEAEFHRRISEVRMEFRGRISDLQAEFCRENSATEGVAVPTVSLPSNETQGQEEWRVVSSGAKRRKVLRALQRVETTNSFTVLEGVEEEREQAGGDEVKRADDWWLGTARLADHCKSNGWEFIDNWDLFYRKDTLYARDGLHSSRQGVRGLAGTLEGDLNALRRIFSVVRRGKGLR
ncbi:hypothetical protein E2C01_055394 [Portunus trituberculatus]|uniref:SGNH hydrolase-type esterase domain-containing protein n=1 Tax=Portunus trituberculatus TaxID=210409 RepID=A0A5B7GXL6_PORTR|nr:hypothetical protein [Portunus trituberculatus]